MKDVIKTAKHSLSHAIAKLTQSFPFLEKNLQFLYQFPFFRKTLKLEAIAYAYLTSFQEPELRLATYNNYQFWVNIAEYQGLFLYFFQEFLEPWSSFITKSLISASDICVDIGANMGSYTFLMAHQVSSKGHIYAFEPLPHLAQNLVGSVAFNQLEDTITIENCSVDSVAENTVKIYTSNDIRNSGISSRICYGDFLNEDCFIESPTVTLQDYCQKQKIKHCHFIKIDVEGSELDVIKGMINLLANGCVDYLLIEQFSGSETQEILNHFGYANWFIDEKRCKLVANIPDGKFGNYLFVNPRDIKSFEQDYIEWLETAA